MKRIFTFIMILLLAGASIDSQAVWRYKPVPKTFKFKVKGSNVSRKRFVQQFKTKTRKQNTRLPLSSQEKIDWSRYQADSYDDILHASSLEWVTTTSNYRKIHQPMTARTMTNSLLNHYDLNLCRQNYELSVLPVKDLYEIDSYSFEMPYVDFCIDYMLVFPIRMLSNLGYAIEYHPVEKISEMGYIMSLSPKQFANLCHSVYLKRKSSGIEPEYVLERDREDNEGAIVLIPRRAVLKNLLLNEGFGSSRKSGEHPNDDFFASQNGSQGQSSGDRLKDIWRDCNDELDDPDYLHTLVELLEDILSGSGDSGGGSSDDDDDDDSSDSGESSKESKESKALEAQENPHQTCLIQP